MTKYARLFTALTRLAEIFTITVEGIACGEYDHCQGHSWNMIYYNNQWLEVDPIWDLMSGIVSSSHVYMSDAQIDMQMSLVK
ncbi:MAG: transglutaminase domain-containing protein [Pseudomonadota bacterium]